MSEPWGSLVLFENWTVTPSSRSCRGQESKPIRGAARNRVDNGLFCQDLELALFPRS